VHHVIRFVYATVLNAGIFLWQALKVLRTAEYAPFVVFIAAPTIASFTEVYITTVRIHSRSFWLFMFCHYSYRWVCMCVCIQIRLFVYCT